MATLKFAGGPQLERALREFGSQIAGRLGEKQRPGLNASQPGSPTAATRWMAANVAVAQDPAGNLKPAKDKSTERIDGIVALIMAIGRAMVAQDEPQPEYSMFFV